MKMPALWHFYLVELKFWHCVHGGSGMSTVGPLPLGLKDQVILTEEDNDLADN